VQTTWFPSSPEEPCGPAPELLLTPFPSEVVEVHPPRQLLVTTTRASKASVNECPSEARPVHVLQFLGRQCSHAAALRRVAAKEAEWELARDNGGNKRRENGEAS